MPTTRRGTNTGNTPPAVSPPATTAGTVNQPVSPATPNVGPNTGTPANATEPGFTFASLEFAVATLFRQPLDGPLMLALRRDGCHCFSDLLSFSKNDLLTLQYYAPILDEQGGDTGQTQFQQLERPYRGLLIALLGYAYLRQHVHRDPITAINCMNIDVQAFLDYQCSGDFIVFNNSSLQACSSQPYCIVP